MITPTSTTMFKCQRCRTGTLRVSSRSIINSVTHDGSTMDLKCEQCGYDMHARAISRLRVTPMSDTQELWPGFNIGDIESCARVLVADGKIEPRQMKAVSDLIVAVVECARVNTIEAIIGAISSVIDIDIVRESVGDEFERAFVATICIDTEALDTATLGGTIGRPPVAARAMRISQRRKKAVYEDGRVELVATPTIPRTNPEPEWRRITRQVPTPRPTPTPMTESHYIRIDDTVSDMDYTASIRMEIDTSTSPDIMEALRRETSRMAARQAELEQEMIGSTTLDEIFDPAYEAAVRRASVNQMDRVAVRRPTPFVARDTETRNTTWRER